MGERKHTLSMKMRSKLNKRVLYSRVLIAKKEMHRKTYPYQGRAYKAIQDELLSLLGRWEHRVEILAAIAHEQRASGRHELAEAYKKQAIESKKHAESVRKLLIGKK